MTSIETAKQAAWLLVSLESHCWTGTQLSRDAKQAAVEKFDTASSAVTAQRNLLCAAKADIGAIQKIHSAARAYLDAVSVSWRRGQRAIPSTSVMEVLARFGEFNSQAQLAVASLATVWAQRVQESVTMLGKLAPDVSAYPSVDALPALYRMSLSLDPMPDSADFTRCPLPQEAVEALIAEHDAQSASRAQAMRDEVIDRAKAAAKKIADSIAAKLRGESVRLYGSALAECAAVAALLTALNEPSLGALIASLQALAALDVDSLRNSSLKQAQAQTLASTALANL